MTRQINPVVEQRRGRWAARRPLFRPATARLRLTVPILSAAVVAFAGAEALAQENAVRLEKSDLTYIGAFKVPTGGNDQNTFSYGGAGIGYNPENNSLFLLGHSHHQRTAEISIPELVNSNNLSDLETATVLQSFTDATNGRLDDINPQDSNDQRIGGHLVYNGRLILAAYSYYDAAATQRASHFVRPLSLTSGQAQGPFLVGDDPHYTGAYMGLVPPEWRSALGGPVLTGNCCRSIISTQSEGPSVSVFDPDDLGSGFEVDAELLLLYTSDNPLGGDHSSQNPYFNLTTRVEGVVFPRGTRSVLFFGKHGIGRYCYGEGDECGDPADSSKGTHAYPYVYQVWAYDANDFVAVRNGSKSATELLPYSVWTFEVPFERDDDHDANGAAYDAERGIISFGQEGGGAERTPIIHAFSVDVGPRPEPPENFRVE